MLDSVQVQEISSHIRVSRVKMKMAPEELAGKANVGAGFIRNLEQDTAKRWGMRELILVLRVLMSLQLDSQVDTVREAIRLGASQVRSKPRRLKFDRRQGGRIISRRN